MESFLEFAQRLRRIIQDLQDLTTSAESMQQTAQMGIKTMKEGIQDSCTNTALKKYGCYYFCLLEWALRLGGMVQDPVKMFEKHTKIGWVEDDCFVVDPVSILNDLQTIKVFKSVSKVTTRPAEEICVQNVKKPGHSHFVLRIGDKTWDPLDPNRPGVKDYVIDSYRRIV